MMVPSTSKNATGVSSADSRNECVAIVVCSGPPHALTYQVPHQWDLSPGQLVVVGLRNRQSVGVVKSFVPPPNFSCKPIAHRVTGELVPPFGDLWVSFVQWVAHYYRTPLGFVLSVALPACVRKAPKVLAWELATEKKLKIKNLSKKNELTPLPPLTEAQEQALNTLLEPGPGLLQGVTGSGKTVVYLHGVARVLAQGKSALILVPEIALTPQLTGRFQDTFGPLVAVVHSQVSPKALENAWLAAARGEARVVLGVRSAVFVPMPHLGLIIVDEEHDASYKCEAMPCYNARDLAVKRAQLWGVPCVLGSATPSLETYANARNGRYRSAHLSQSFGGVAPLFQWAPVGRELGAMAYSPPTPNPPHPGTNPAPGAPPPKPLAVKGPAGALGLGTNRVAFTQRILGNGALQALQETWAKGEQSLILLNRRGVAQSRLCLGCGHVPQCPQCSVSATLHRNQEMCHYCGWRAAPPRPQCPQCHRHQWAPLGAGTERLEEELGALLPHMAVGRLDRDTLTSQTRLKKVLGEFRQGKTQCLVGTQLLAKGHDFPKVSLLVLLYLEEGLYFPDLRARERTFQLLTQSIGRVGRAGLPGLVLLQTLLGEEPAVVTLARRGQVEAFLKDEMEARALVFHPPFSRMVVLEWTSKLENRAIQVARAAVETLMALWQSQGVAPHMVKIHGPIPATMSRLKGEYRFHATLWMDKSLAPWTLLPDPWLDQEGQREGVAFRVDVDAQTVM